MLLSVLLYYTLPYLSLVEMVDLVRGAVTEQRAKLTTVQRKIAIVEHLLLLAETICGKYQKMKGVYESSSRKKGAGEEAGQSSKDTSAAHTTNRTVLHFNKLIIDQRRKLEALDKKIAAEVKKAGRLEPHEMYHRDDQPLAQVAVDSCSARTPLGGTSKGMAASSTPNKKPFGGAIATPSSTIKKGPRRASVSLRQALSVDSPSAAKSIKPFSNMPVTPLREEEEEADEDDDEVMSTFGMTQQEKDRRELFKKSESDRLQLISENRRLREQVKEVGARQLERMVEDLDPELHSIVSELNLWDCERDELDAQIDRLTDQRDVLLQQLLATSRGKQMKASGSLIFIEDDDNDSSD